MPNALQACAGELARLSRLFAAQAERCAKSAAPVAATAGRRATQDLCFRCSGQSAEPVGSGARPREQVIPKAFPLLKFFATSRTNWHAVLSVQRAVKVARYIPVQPVHFVSVHACDMHVKTVLRDKAGFAMRAFMGGLL